MYHFTGTQITITLLLVAQTPDDRYQTIPVSFIVRGQISHLFFEPHEFPQGISVIFVNIPYTLHPYTLRRWNSSWPLAGSVCKLHWAPALVAASTNAVYQRTAQHMASRDRFRQVLSTTLSRPRRSDSLLFSGVVRTAGGTKLKLNEIALFLTFVLKVMM